MLWYFFALALRLDFAAVSSKIMLPTLKITTGTIDGLEIAPVMVHEERLPGSQIIKEPAPAHHILQFAIRQTLIKHGEVVAEVEVGLHGITLGQCAATYVIHVTIRQANNPAATDA